MFDLEKLNRPFVSLAQNSFPWSVMISSGTPNRQIHLSKMAVATGKDSFLGMATISALSVLREGISHAEDILYAGLRFDCPEQVSMHSLLWLGTL